jgi:hypothetical protein
LVNGFDEAWAQQLVDFHRSADDLVCESSFHGAQ